MIAAMKARPFVNRLAASLCAATVLLSTTHARADDDEVPDARTAGYSNANSQAPDVSMKSSSAASFAAFAFLAVLCVGFLFKNANRTHLD